MIEKVSLLTNRRDFFYLFITAFILLFFSLSFEYYNYKQLTKFDSSLIDAKVLKQYTKTSLTKTGKTKEYQVLKLKSDKGFTFYTIASKKLSNIKRKNIQIEVWAGEISFSEYIKGFFAFSKILEIYDNNSFKVQLSQTIENSHKDKNISNVYKALFLAIPLDRELQTTFSNLGVSHLIAISGFHLGILSTLLFFIIKYPYKFLQNRYFPYRSYTLDSFIIIALALFVYLLFLDVPPSLLRSFVMLMVGFFLYDRGIKIISMETLLLTVLIILALFPRLFFSMGFWLSSAGVFYIFLFLIHFKRMSKLWQFVLVPLWVYLLMLPFSLALFGNFSLSHPLSIIWTSLFTLFYPLSIVVHILGFGNLLDFALKYLIELDLNAVKIVLEIKWLVVEIILSFISIYKKEFVYILLLYVLSIFIYAINYVT